MTAILIVDDDDNTRMLIHLMLKRGGYSVQPAANAQQELEVLEHDTPDLIILDLALPEMTGLELCREIRQHPATQETPILVFTASVDTFSLRESQEAGANAFVRKPISPDDLLAKVRSLLSG